MRWFRESKEKELERKKQKLEKVECMIAAIEESIKGLTDVPVYIVQDLITLRISRNMLENDLLDV